MRRPGWCLLVVLSTTLCALALSGPVARAEADAATPAEGAEPAAYRAAIDQAIAEYEAKNHEEARALFARAHESFPNARSLRGMGMADFELRRYEDSAKNLEAALASPVRPLTGELREQTSTLLTRARGFLAVLHVVLTPESAVLEVDGQATADRNPLTLALGEHVLEASAEGYLSQKKLLRVHGGEQLELSFALLRTLLADSESEPPRPLYKNPWLWTGVGAVVVGVIVAGVLIASRDDGGTRLVGEGTANTPPGVMLGSLGGR